jgi:hypothetical protein
MAEPMLGYKSYDLVGMSLGRLLNNRNDLDAVLETLNKGHEWSGTLEVKTSKGAIITTKAIAGAMGDEFDSMSSQYMFIFTPIS